MKESSTKYARKTWIDTYEDEEYYELLRECYEKCKVPKEQGQKRHQWRCIYCKEVFQCRSSLNYHRHKVCPTVGHHLKQYPIVDKGQRIVMKGQQAIVKGQLGKRKGVMASIEEGGMPHTITDWLEDDQFLRDTRTHHAPVMTTPNISNVLLEERGVSSNSERNPICDLSGVEVMEIIETTGLAMGLENHEHVEVEGDGEGHALEVENEEWGWSPLFCLLRDFPELRPPDFPERPWKHTIEEFDVIQRFLKDRKAHRTEPLRPPFIVLALVATWHFHFGDEASIMDDYVKLVEKLECVSHDKEFVDNLSRMQHLMRTKDGLMTRYAKLLFLAIPDDCRDDEPPTLEDDVSSFKATSEIPGHKEVIKRVVDWFIGIVYCAMEDYASNLGPMWYSKFLSRKKELIIENWKFFCLWEVSLRTGFTLQHLKKHCNINEYDVDVAVSGWRLMFEQVKVNGYLNFQDVLGHLSGALN
ncbi:unnamed protein product [Sphagnum jensenii]|uniref:Transposase n=1 Tax=Sphagnum jensenii TaxID=128206 RepID=A0ABP1BAJ9_9BRYO